MSSFKEGSFDGELKMGWSGSDQSQLPYAVQSPKNQDRLKLFFQQTTFLAGFLIIDFLSGGD